MVSPKKKIRLNAADTWVIAPITMANPESGASLRMFTVLRVVRLLKLIRMLRVIKGFQQLYLMVVGLTHALRSLVWVCFMLLCCICI